jgi:arabinogalactan endo-1,4-beta-galactosidase
MEKSAGSARGNREDFRVALSLSPFSLPQFEQGYSFRIGERTASTPQELQAAYCEKGATEMFVRIATKRHRTTEDITDGKPDSNANVHTLDQGIELCRIAAELGIPINPEIMCAYTYMDMEAQQEPRFEEYPEIISLQKGKRWQELTLDEICTVLHAYGLFVAERILETGCTVNNWNLGNEANYGFAGISYGLETAVNPRLHKMPSFLRYVLPTFAPGWLKRNIWQYNAKAYASLRAGILAAYEKLGIDDSGVKFSTHIATVVATPKSCAAFFNCLKENGYAMDTAGISYYPSAPSLARDKDALLKQTVTIINQKCSLPVFVAEFSYPSGKMEGAFAGWNQKLGDYEQDEHGQASLYADVIAWGRKHGMAGIRYWAPDFEGWYTMSMFTFRDKTGTAKEILKQHKEIADGSYS